MSQSDSLNSIIYQNILSNKTYYIGKPLKVLFDSIKVKVGFSDPDNKGRLRKGKAYYQRFSIYLPSRPGVGLYAFRVRIANKVYVQIEDQIKSYYETDERLSWDSKMKILLRNQILIDIK